MVIERLGEVYLVLIPHRTGLEILGGRQGIAITRVLNGGTVHYIRICLGYYLRVNFGGPPKAK
jgi:hypothetical protein